MASIRKFQPFSMCQISAKLSILAVAAKFQYSIPTFNSGFKFKDSSVACHFKFPLISASFNTSKKVSHTCVNVKVSGLMKKEIFDQSQKRMYTILDIFLRLVGVSNMCNRWW